jgi:hypothetical protein
VFPYPSPVFDWQAWLHGEQLTESYPRPVVFTAGLSPQNQECLKLNVNQRSKIHFDHNGFLGVGEDGAISFLFSCKTFDSDKIS